MLAVGPALGELGLGGQNNLDRIEFVGIGTDQIDFGGEGLIQGRFRVNAAEPQGQGRTGDQQQRQR